jgi:Tfp pilus assembly protein PilN
MLGGWFLINVNLDQINDTIADKTSLLQSNRIQVLSSEVSDYNKSLESINAISNSEFDWLKIYEKITEATPSSVTLKSLDIYLNENLASTKPPTWIITIVGVTNDRQTVIDYSDNLAKTEIFDEVNVPISALSSSEDVDFQINMELTFNNLLKDPTKFKKVSAVSEIVFD